MIKINKYHIKRLDASNITIHEEYLGSDKDGNPKTQYRFIGYFSTLPDALLKILDCYILESTERETIEDMLGHIEHCKAEIINALGKCQDFHEFE